MEHLYDYLGFLARTATVVVALLIVVSSIAALAIKRQQQHVGHLEIRKLNEHYQDLKYGVQEALLPASLVKKARKQEEKARRAADKAAARSVRQAEEGAAEPRKRMFVIDFNGDLHASQVKQLREEVTAVLTAAAPEDEVVVRLESPGGLVHGYGLAASQLARIRDQGIPLTVVVDKVAASGGYLMAVVADRILAAPFAVVGSIGVVAQVPNVHRLLKRHDVDVEVLTAGKYKRTLTVFGENTEAARQKFVEELEEIHGLFQSFVGAYRGQVDLERVATGESWHGQHALDLKLVDELCTSDAYLLAQSENADLFEVRWVEHKRPIDRLMAQVESRLDATAERWVGKLTNWRGGA
jgi:serine protease SohB